MLRLTSNQFARRSTPEMHSKIMAQFNQQIAGITVTSSFRPIDLDLCSSIATLDASMSVNYYRTLDSLISKLYNNNLPQVLEPLVQFFNEIDQYDKLEDFDLQIVNLCKIIFKKIRAYIVPDRELDRDLIVSLYHQSLTLLFSTAMQWPAGAYSHHFLVEQNFLIRTLNNLPERLNAIEMISVVADIYAATYDSLSTLQGEFNLTNDATITFLKSYLNFCLDHPQFTNNHLLSCLYDAALLQTENPIEERSTDCFLNYFDNINSLEGMAHYYALIEDNIFKADIVKNMYALIHLYQNNGEDAENIINEFFYNFNYILQQDDPRLVLLFHKITQIVNQALETENIGYINKELFNQVSQSAQAEYEYLLPSEDEETTPEIEEVSFGLESLNLEDEKLSSSSSKFIAISDHFAESKESENDDTELEKILSKISSSITPLHFFSSKPLLESKELENTVEKLDSLPPLTLPQLVLPKPSRATNADMKKNNGESRPVLQPLSLSIFNRKQPTDSNSNSNVVKPSTQLLTDLGYTETTAPDAIAKRKKLLHGPGKTLA